MYEPIAPAVSRRLFTLGLEDWSRIRIVLDWNCCLGSILWAAIIGFLNYPALFSLLLYCAGFFLNCFYYYV